MQLDGDSSQRADVSLRNTRVSVARPGLCQPDRGYLHIAHGCQLRELAFMKLALERDVELDHRRWRAGVGLLGYLQRGAASRSILWG